MPKVSTGFPFYFFNKTIKNASAISDDTWQNAGDSEVYKVSEQFGPFNKFTLQNSSSVDVKVRFDSNPDKEYLVPAGNQLDVDPAENFWFREAVYARNNSVTINANEIRVIWSRVLVEV